MTICILISYVLTSFKEMSWPIKFIKSAESKYADDDDSVYDTDDDEFEYEQSEEVNSLLVRKLALEVELEIEREFI